MSGTAAGLYRITAGCAFGSAYQQVESVALLTDLQAGNVSVFAVPTCKSPLVARASSQ